jgi:hypothetical protein
LNPLTTADVAAALEAAGGAARGIRIEDWNDGKDGVDSHPGVTLCKSLGFVAESGGAKRESGFGGLRASRDRRRRRGRASRYVVTVWIRG